MNVSLKDDCERFTREKGEGGWREGGGEVEYKRVFDYTLYSAVMWEGRKLPHDLDTKSESVFLVFFQRPSPAVWTFKWVLG